MAIELRVGGHDLTWALQFGSLQVTDTIGERSTCSFDLQDADGSIASLVEVGMAVEVLSDGVAVFGGSLEPWGERHLPGSMSRAYRMDCVDWTAIADRHVVAETYLAARAGEIVRDLVDKYLAGDGVTYAVDSVQDGPTVVECVFNYTPATNCLDGLAEKAGFSWWIDSQKVLHFCERASYVAPWALNSESLANDVRDLVVEHRRDGYRNRQYIKAGKDITDPQVETFEGNGSQMTWTVGFPIAKVPTVEISTDGGQTWSLATAGIKGLESNKDWYWNKGDAILTQDAAAAPLRKADPDAGRPYADLLRVTYQGFFDVVILTTDEAAIEGRKAVEGGSGRYDAVEDEPYLSSREAAIQSGNAKLRKYSKLSKALTIKTDRPGLRAGQLLSADLADRGISGDFLIEEVEFGQISESEWEFTVKAVSGEALGSWARFFKNMATRGQAFVVRENIREDQVLIYLVQASETWAWSENTTITVNACPIPSANLYPSASLYPC